ncbi:30S ribosomal protein S8e [Candidatus Woesearchaeota archaeon]|nr:30S ribosomal protein S8e [Candidatus Woesearchaeota archaeon]
MARSQRRSTRKPSGGRYHYQRTKRNFELAGIPANTRVDAEKEVRCERTPGGHHKYQILTTNEINVADKAGKVAKTKILNVVENPANPHLVRRNIMTKGAVVETELGRTKITSRPGQKGSLSGVLLA